MAVTPSQVVFVGSVNMADADGLTTGGAVNAARLINFSDMAANGTINYVSSSASDTGSICTVSYRDATGVLLTEARTLTGTTPVAGSATMERLMKGVMTGTAAVGDTAAYSNTAIVTGTAVAGAAASATADATITLASGHGASVALGQVLRFTNNLPAGVNFMLRRIIAISGDVVSVNRDWNTVPTSASTYAVHRGMLFDILPILVTENRRPFYNVASDAPGGATRIYYEKMFAIDWNSATALTAVNILKQVDPSSGTIDFALTSALNDTTTAANRQTAPAGIGSFSSGAAPQTIAVPSPQNLPAGAAPNAAGAQGVWLRQTLTAGLAAAKTSVTMRATGNTT